MSDGRNFGQCAKVIKVIQTDLEVRGNGKDTPLRIIRQYWSFEGDLLAEADPCAAVTEGARQPAADAISSDGLYSRPVAWGDWP
jgi:hypothetical protein